MKVSDVTEIIGNTPHIRLNRLFGQSHEVWVKFEARNPGGSIKDRIALAMIEDAEREGILKKDTVIIETCKRKVNRAGIICNFFVIYGGYIYANEKNEEPGQPHGALRRAAHCGTRHS